MQMTKRHSFIAAALVLVSFSFRSWSQEVEVENVPDDILQSVELGQFAHSYIVDGSVNPFYLRGDFDGDGKIDYAVRIKSKATRESGIAIWLSGLHNFMFLGAGTAFKMSGSSVSNLGFLNIWQVYGRKPIERGVESGPPPHLVGEAILVGKRESASGLIYWSGKSFVWYQQGD